MEIIVISNGHITSYEFPKPEVQKEKKTFLKKIEFTFHLEFLLSKMSERLIWAFSHIKDISEFSQLF